MAASIKPVLYRGQQIPFERLQPDQFEKFIFASLEYIAPLHDFRVLGECAGTGDGGFDVYGECLSASHKGQIVCIQCKRYTGTLLLSHISIEIAKVALRSKKEASHVSRHFFICSGEVSQDLYSAVREIDKKKIVAAAIDKGINSVELKSLRDSLHALGASIDQVIRDYISNLDVLIIWSGRDYDSQLGRVWSKAGDLLDKYFSIETVLREYPRPDFDMIKYIMECRESMTGFYWQLPFASHGLPNNVYVRSNSPDNTSAKAMKEGAEDLISVLISCTFDTSILLLGAGGAGKTTVLLAALSKIAEKLERQEDHLLPVFISLERYRGDVKKLINDRLRITHGSWESLPGPFIFFFDGLDEITDTSLIQHALDEINSINKRHLAFSIISMRTGGLRRPATIKFDLTVIKIQNISIRYIRNIAALEITDARLRKAFLEQVYDRLDWQILKTALGIKAAIDLARTGQNLPTNEKDLIQEFLSISLNRNRQRAGLSERLAELPEVTIVEVQQEVAFEFRFGRYLRNKQNSPMEHGTVALKQALENIRRAGIFGADSLDDVSMLQLARHFEILTQIDGKIFRTSHDVITDFLAAKTLAFKWRECLCALEFVTADDAWVFASSKIPPKDIEPFLKEVARVDLMLAARCAAQMGDGGEKMLEPAIFELEQESGIRAGYIASRALSILASSRCIEALHVKFLGSSDADRRFQGLRELVRVGDEQAMLYALEKADQDASDESVSISGGEGGTFQYAPPLKALRLCRQRVRENPSSKDLVLSLQMIENYGDESDSDSVMEVLVSASTVSVLFAAVRCMKVINSSNAINYLIDQLESSMSLNYKIYFAEALTYIGHRVNTLPFLELVLNSALESPSRSQASSLIEKNSPWDNMGDRLYTAYHSTDSVGRHCIWRIAKKHNLSTFDDLAFTVLKDCPDEEVGLAVEFAGSRNWDANLQAKFSEEALKLISGPNPKFTYCWHTFSILQYMISQRREAEIAYIVFAKLYQLIKFHIDMRNSIIVPEFGVYGKSLGIVLGGKSDLGIRIAINGLLPIAGSLAKLSTESLIDKILEMRMEFLDDESLVAFRKLIANVTDEYFDKKLLELKDHRDRLILLINSGRKSITAARIYALSEAGPHLISMPLMRDSISEILITFWCPEVLRIITEAVVTYKWSEDEYAFQLFRDIMEAVGHQITANDALQILPAYIDNLEEEAIEILNFWHECGITRRSNS